ncbi:MAG: Rieske 2Fe-2S domain-containing protein [Hyphomonadaceae bacterium]|nr:Rieske 2Fe-2S domain-containing protein [Hyphomonadaceae bacterium]MBC6411917.1 Rieske 2Fe-2S domain-containing protein [Hyphomonadaceae bacterium]
MGMDKVEQKGAAAVSLDRVAPTSTYGQRIRAAAKRDFKRWLLKRVSGLPFVGRGKHDIGKPEIQVFSSESGFMARWYAKDYGTADKPSALLDLPLDYMERHQEEIPFFGLREYWYPALFSHELKHNEHKAVRMLGDNIILFRDKDGSPCALENRCPHRSSLLSLGQVNVWDVGTITCRYHGMTFDKKGNCVAFMADGAGSPACGRVKAKAYPAEEIGGVIFIYFGIREPKSIIESMAHAREVLSDGELIRSRMTVPYSFLNQLDNTVDMTHVGCLHRSCYLFGDQKMGGGVKFRELPGNGVHATLREEGGHAGHKHIDEIRWFMPNLVHHGEEFMNGGVNGIFFWFVPNDAGTFTGWMLGSIKKEKVGRLKAKMMATILRKGLQSDSMPNLACFIGGDAPMQLSQGRVVRWDRDYLARTDRAVLKVRQMMKDAHKEEQELRKTAGLDPLVHRIKNGQID